MKKKHYLILLFLTLLSLENFATHIVGGEIYYDCLGGNNYRITLKLYRDCYNGLAAYDNPASVFIFNSSGTFLDSLEVPYPGSVVLPIVLNNPCLTPPTNVCVEEAIYQVVVNLPPLVGGYDITYQRCCRNGTILNLVNPGAVGSTYMAHIPDPGVAVCNSSPRFTNFPPIFLCAGVPLNFDHSATDPDGDSLYYALCDPFTGLSAACPILGVPGQLSGCPGIASPPPYSYVPFSGAYNGTYPMSSSPALAVDPVTGLMTGTPNMIGQWVVGVCVSEYRNGVLVDVNKRDFQFNIVNCGIPVASIPVQQPFCFGFPSSFTQNSVNAFSYHWDFGDPGTILDTSNVFSPSWTYAAIGTYTLTLIINPGTLCTDTASMAVTVNPLPAVTSANTATICSGGTLSIPLTGSLASTFTWIASNNVNTTGESITAQSGNTLSNTIINNTTAVQTVSYTVTPTSNPEGCVGTAQTVIVTVNPAPTMTSSNSATICNGGTVSIPLTSNMVSTYSWIAADNVNTTGESLVVQAGSPISNTITNNSSSIQTVVYTVTPTSTAIGNCVGTPQTVNVSVMPTPAMTSSAVATICNGGTVSIPLTGNVASTYSWIAADNVNTTGESLTAQSGTPLSNTITNATLLVQTVSYTVTPTSVTGSCPGTPQTITVTVNPSPVMTSAVNATVCSGVAVNFVFSANTASTFTWIATNNPNTSGESLTTQAGGTLSDIIANNTVVAQTVSYSVTPISNPQGCSGAPQTVNVTVNPGPTMTSSNAATICTGGTVSIPLTSNYLATYSWFAVNNVNTTGESTTAQAGTPLTNTITNNTTSVQNVIYAVTATTIPGGCVGIPQIVTVSVIPTPTVTASAATICNGGTVSIPLSSNVNSSYSWIAADNLNTTGESITPQTGNPLSNTITNNTTSAQTVSYTITPTSTAGSCPGTPLIVAVSVNPSPTMTSVAGATICNGDVVSINLTGDMASTFTWIAVDNVNITGESITTQSGSTLSNTLINITAVAQTVSYTVTPTSNPLGCLGTPQTVSVTVNPSPSMTNPNSATICNGATVNIPLTSSMASTYTWIAADNTNTTGESTTLQNGSPLNNTISNTSTATQTVIYTVTPTLISGTCPGVPQTLTVTVVPTPILTSTPLATICNGGTVNIPLTGNVASTYSWIAADNTNTTGESLTAQAGSPLSNTITNNSTSVETVDYTITPTSTPDGCAGTPQTVTVTVNPDPIMTSVDTATICNGDSISIPLTSNIPAAYTWIAADNVNTTGESITAQTGSPLSNAIINTSTVVQTVIYTVTPTSSPDSCAGIPQTVTVTINPSPVMTNPDTAIICDGSIVSIPLTSTMLSTYSWIAADNTNTTGESTTLQAGTPLTDTITNTSSSVQTVIYTVTPSLISGTCPGIPQTITVTVIPTPAITSPIAASICSGDLVSIPLTSNIPSTYSWVAADNTNTSGESITAQTGSPLSNSITNNSDSDQAVIYTVTPTSNPDGCAGTPQTVTVTVYGDFSADFDFITVPCTNQVTFYDSSALGPVSWLWYFDDGDSSTLQNPSHTYSTTGSYYVQLISSTINGCADTVIVQADFGPIGSVLISQNDTICKGNSTQLIATGGISYLWSPAGGLSNPSVSNPTASPDTTTTYTVLISTVNSFNDTCVQILSTTVYVIDPSNYTIFATTENDSLLQGQSTIIHAITDSTLTVNWSPSTGMSSTSSFNPTVSPESTTTYTVSILDSVGCPKTASVTVYVLSKECDIANVFVPNTFTPNGDGNNDVLYVRGKEIKKLYFAIYNRRGELVFETTDINKGWDGIYNGKKADPDVFAWYLRAKCFAEGELQNKGNVTLIR